jgi:hypothetical protein
MTVSYMYPYFNYNSLSQLQPRETVPLMSKLATFVEPEKPVFTARESLVIDIPGGDGKIPNLFLQCTFNYNPFSQLQPRERVLLPGLLSLMSLCGAGISTLWLSAPHPSSTLSWMLSTFTSSGSLVNTSPHISLALRQYNYPHCKDKTPKFRNKYSQKRNIGVSVPVSTFMRLCAIYIFLRSVCLFC